MEGVVTMKGWFAIPGVQTGDRTLEEQLTGLPVDELACGDVLDIGSAEGLISKHLLERGAAQVDCIDNNTKLCDVARRVLKDHRFASVYQADLNDKTRLAELDRDLAPSYETVLLLSILQKLEDPAHVLRWAAAKVPMTGHVIAIRLPTGPVVVNKFSKKVMCDVREILAGFDLEERPGPRGEWVGIFRRR
jgi:2-polyprenyl-3-methyl-5-hydroxy-6-metoxy-1,4-benzoquinol methylase